MTSMDNSFIPKRRGLSSVVGALLFVVLMVATFSVLGVALDSQTQIVDTNRKVTETKFLKQEENFIITNAIQPPSGNLQIDVDNLNPQYPTEINTLIVTHISNITGGFPTDVHDIPYKASFIPPKSNPPIDILSSSNVTLPLAVGLGTINYDIKVISSLGKIAPITVFCDSSSCSLGGGGGGGSTGLVAQVFSDGPNAVNTKTSTLVMFITNTGEVPLTNVAPIMGQNATPALRECDDMWLPNIPPVAPQITDVNPCDIDSAIASWTLAPSQTAMFKWDGRIIGNIGDEVIFCNQASGLDGVTPVTSNLSCDEITVIDPNDCGGCEGGGEAADNVIIIDDLLIRPSIFLTIPSPFGIANDDNDVGVWGVNVANPTNSTMSISKVTITAFAPGANDNTDVFDKTPGMNHTNISPPGPGLLGSWFVGNTGSTNVAVWKNFTNPILLPPYSNESFLIKIKPENVNGQWESIIVQASVFSTSGSFGKAGYQTTMYGSPGDGDSPIANVYLTDAIDSKNSANILGHRDDIGNGTVQDFSVFFGDMDGDAETEIVQGAKLIVNVPRDWAEPTVHSGNTTNIVMNATSPSIQKHGDGTWQIIAITDKNLGNATSPFSATLSFNTTAPNKFCDNMHIMYVLGYGQDNGGWSIGPLSEIVLHVFGNSTGIC